MYTRLATHMCKMYIPSPAIPGIRYKKGARFEPKRRMKTIEIVQCKTLLLLLFRLATLRGPPLLLTESVSPSRALTRVGLWCFLRNLRQSYDSRMYDVRHGLHGSDVGDDRFETYVETSKHVSKR